MAWADVTPPAFTHMTGMDLSRKRPVGAHDRLKARALVLAAGGEKIALVSVDMNYIGFDGIAEVRRIVERYTDIKGANVRVTSSHSHSSPGFCPMLKDEDACRAAWGPIYEEERLHVLAACRLIAGAVYEANLHLVDAEIGFGSGASKFNIVRWHLGADGKMRYIPYNRELPVNLEAHADMFIMHVRAKVSRKTLAFYYTNSAHAICVCLQSDLITADYPGCVAAIIEKKFGGQCMFCPGMIGDQHPVDFDRGLAAAEKMGRQLAGEIVKAQKKMKYVSRVAIHTRETEFDLPAREDSKVDLFRTRASVVLLNDVALAYWPGEPFGMINRKLAAESPFKRTVVVANTDDFKFYFALADEFSRYQWDPLGARPSIYGVNAGDQVCAVILGMLREMKKST